MALVDNVKDAFARVAVEVNAMKAVDGTLAQAITDLDQAIIALEARPLIVVSATEPVAPAEGTIWLDTSGT